MRRVSKKITRSDVEHATVSSSRTILEWLKRAEEIIHDTDKQARLQSCRCQACFYVRSGISGAAMTYRECGICGKDELYGSTNTDSLCIECAKENGLCKHCGGDIEMKTRRKPYPFMERSA